MKNVFKIFKTVLGIVSDICFIFILLYGIIFIPMLVGYRPMVMEGRSKEISYKEGSLLYYQKVKADEVKINDVIVYKPGSEYIIHKVNKVVHEEEEASVSGVTEQEEDNTASKPKKTYYLTNQDAYSTTHPNRIAYEDVIGKIGNVYVPYAGFYVGFVMNHLKLLYVAIAVVLLGFVIGMFVKDDEEKKEEKKVI